MSIEKSDSLDTSVKVSSSPERHTFQKESYLKRCQEEGKQPNQAYLEMWDKVAEEDKEWAYKVERSNNLEWDLRTNQWILDKVRNSKTYAQNLYAAMCNMRFVRKEMFPYLRQDPDKDLWSCSWRSSGGIIADMLGKGDYIDWYCSGIRQGYEDSDDPAYTNKKFVPEGYVTTEIEEDLLKLGWIPVPWPED
jgi:hypothetical protein